MSKTYSAGIVTAYGAAKRAGYQGTYEDFCRQQAGYAGNAAAVEAAKTAAQTAANTATAKATEATTAATAAQTAKTQTEQAASQALTDISTARSGAISAVQTEGQTQTANARAQAQAAAQSATTASTKASEASASATTATTKATEAAASATAAAQSASDAQDVLDSIPADYSDLSSNVSQLQADFTAMESDGVVPSAEQILTDKGVTDSAPYRYRKTGGDGADREYVDAVVGGTVNWNQLVQNGNFMNTDSWSRAGSVTSFTVANNKATLVCTQATDNTFIDQHGKNIISGHKYIIGFDYKKSSSSPYAFWGTYPNVLSSQRILSALSGRFETITSATATNTTRIRIGMRDSNPSGEWTYSIWNVMMFDLTAMFGTEIADYIYSLEQANAGAGVAFFRKLFPNDYYEYNSGELVSVSGLSAHKMVGFNQWDEEWELGGLGTGGNSETDKIRSKNYIPVVSGNTYFFYCESNALMFVNCYDSDKNYLSSFDGMRNVAVTIPEYCRYIRFRMQTAYGTTYKNNICINLSNPAKNGTYEPYKAHSYPLDNTLTLRGIPTLVDGKFKWDGDMYEYTGKVTRNTILRAYQSGDESLANAITDGTNTVVYSANASTEQATPYQHLQQCDPNGTEEYVSTEIILVGHNSFYPENLRAKVEQLPWNFASLIAPTESAFVATRNYVTGDLFIVSNVLYKATSNIANGGTITPNTNVVATTLSEIIASLS